MAIVFTYTESTNTVVVTGGTSGTPATFADFVTADRAGTAVLLVATAGLSPTLPLDYQIRPVENIALLITFNVASKTTETDYIFITGTDWRDAAQTESIDVSAGDGAYVTTKYFRTITNIDCSDNSAGGGTVWADGTIEVTQPQWGVIWDYGDGQYYIDCTGFNIGDNSTSTYFKSTNENVTLKTYFQRLGSANLQIGEKIGDWSYDGSTWRFIKQAETQIRLAYGNSGYTYIYGSTITSHDGLQFINFRFGDVIILNSLFNCGTLNTNSYVQFTSNLNSVILKDTYFSYLNRLVSELDSAIINNIHVHYCTRAFRGFGDGFVSNANFTGVEDTDYYSTASSGTFTIRDPRINISTVELTNNGHTLVEQYSCNIHVADKDGVALQSVVVDCEDTNTNAVWAAGTISTDASGDIAEQYINYKSWTSTDETLTSYSPHKFTLSKAGYETLILENVTVDAPIVWHLELQHTKGAKSRQIGMGV